MIPTALRDRDKWVCWRYDKRNGNATKVPIAADDPNGGHASATDSINWSDYETAAQTADYYDHIDGVGFVFHAGGPIAGIDLDGCRVPATGTITDYAKAIIELLDSYTEVSPSGTGVHIYVEGDKPGDRNRSGDVEIYDSKRFFTVTGDHLNGTPKSVRSAHNGLAAIYDQYLADDHTADTDSSCPQSGVSRTSDPTNIDKRRLLERARSADRTGEKFIELFDRGNTAGYPSHSEADLALMNMLAFWTGKHKHRMIRLFRQSALGQRDKADRDDYLERTADKAIRDTRNTYDPEYYADDVSDVARETFEEITSNGEKTLATADGGRLIVADETVVRVVDALEELGEASTAVISKHDSVNRGPRQVRRAINYLEENDALESQRDGRSISYSLLD